VSVRVDRDTPLDAITGAAWDDAPRSHLTCPPDYWLAGVREASGYLPFGQRRPTPGSDVVEQLAVVAHDLTCATIRLVSPEAFECTTGRRVEPLDPDSAYGGWRLP
jgi:hypothetical protein